ncbi:MAG: hypothetical protein U0V56_11770 [Actinomycetota bacterium]
MSTVEADVARDALVERLFAASLGMAELLTIHLGDRLGLYAAIEAAGSVTEAELAGRAGIDLRYAREWLEQQGAAGILAVDDPGAAPDARRFSLPPVTLSRSWIATAPGRSPRWGRRSPRSPA